MQCDSPRLGKAREDISDVVYHERETARGQLKADCGLGRRSVRSVVDTSSVFLRRLTDRGVKIVSLFLLSGWGNIRILLLRGWAGMIVCVCVCTRDRSL